jgi:tetratricopeptide (TPR) repeat protein
LHDRALKNAQKAVALDEDDAMCHVILGYMYLYAKQLDKAEFHQLRALTLNPNYAHNVAHMGLLSRGYDCRLPISYFEINARLVSGRELQLHDRQSENKPDRPQHYQEGVWV